MKSTKVQTLGAAVLQQPAQVMEALSTQLGYSLAACLVLHVVSLVPRPFHEYIHMR